MKKRVNKILLVDDHSKNIQILANMLSEAGYDFEYAKNGIEALEWLDEDDFDLVLLDVMMPEMDGFEACRRIRKIKRLKELPIIFLTARADIKSLLEGFKVGGQDYVAKPFHSEELLARVKTQLDLRKNKEDVLRMNTWLKEKIEEQTGELEEANTRIIKASMKIDNFDDVKVEFLQIISHEIRTPLNHIVGFNALLQEMDDSESSAKYLDYINKAIDRLESFSYRALDITQLRMRGGEMLSFQEIELEVLTRKLIDQKRTLSKQGCNFILSVADGLSTVMADQVYLSKAILPVLENSVNHVGENGEIHCSIYEEDGMQVLKIIDSGPGFSSKALDSLFEAVAPGVKHIDKDNVGLGLYLVKLVVDAHAGEVKAGNIKDGGAWVTITIPVAPRVSGRKS